jgi:hypothetical protein
MPKQTIPLSIICHNPPSAPGATFGLQDKTQTLHAGVTQPDGALRFTCTVSAEQPPDGTPNFRGPFTHGTPADRFLYLSLGQGGAQPHWVRRIKVMLGDITWSQVEQVIAQDGPLLEIVIDGRKASRAAVIEDWTVKRGA